LKTAQPRDDPEAPKEDRPMTDRSGHAAVEYQVDALVVGAGVVGLACARALAQAGREVWVLDAAEGIGTGISSRNSEVVHAGLYYEPGSLKARHCVAGREMLYRYCEARGVGHSRCGKLIVATRDEERGALATIEERARASGVDSLQSLDRAQVHAMEPALHAVAALWSPDTGIVDSHGLMLALQGDAEAAGASFVFRTPVVSAQRDGDAWRVGTGGDEPMTLTARWLVNAAGLGAVRLAAAMQGFPSGHVPRAWLAKGSYFSLTGRAPFSRLIYPVPEPGGLGTHLTLDLGGQAKFGPDVEWVEHEDYLVDPSRRELFEASIRRYWPALPEGALQPAYAGIRPKISGPGEPAADFRIDGPREHGAPGVVQLFGIESPGLTSALSIAEQVRGVVVG
jgi:L-2-hydroxyglutarate oxidase LhgO